MEKYYREEIVQIMPAPQDLRMWLDEEDGTKASYKPLCLALVKMYEEDGTVTTEIRYVHVNPDGRMITIVVDDSDFLLGVEFDGFEHEVKPLTDHDKRVIEGRKNGLKGFIV